MAKSDVLVRMKADTQNYDANIAKARRTLDGFMKDNLSLGGALNQAAKSFTAYAAGIASVSAAVGAIKSVISESVELAKAGEGVRVAFERLNRPDLLDNLKEATHGTVSEIELMKQAVKFSDFKLNLDEMGALLSFAQQKAKDTGQSVDYMVDSIVTGLGRQSLMILDNLGLSAAQIKEKMKEGGDMTKAVAAIIKEQMTAAGEYVETAADKAARAAADAANEMERLGRDAMPIAEAWNEAWNEIKRGGMELLVKVIGPLAQSMKELRQLWATGKPQWNVTPKPGITNVADNPNVDDNGNYINKPKSSMTVWSAISNIPDVVVSGTQSKKKTKIGSTKIGKTENVRDKIAKQLDTAMLRSIAAANTMSVPEESGPSPVWQLLTQNREEKWNPYEEAQKALEAWNDAENVTAQNMKNDAKEIKASWKDAAGAIGSLGSALQGLEDPGAKIAGIIGQAVANIALGFAEATKAAAGGGPFAWIAAIAGGLTTMVSTIAAIHSATGFSEGGVVKGNTFSCDQIPAMLNAGEVVLTRAQAGVLASNLQGGGLQNLHLTATISGTQLRFVLNNESQARGRGQYVTTNFG